MLLVLDEVMTSRLSTGGLQQVHRLTPDLTTFGKYIGGGLAFGAFGGRADLLSRFDPSRPDSLPHAGTFNNAVLTMAAGAAGLTRSTRRPKSNASIVSATGSAIDSNGYAAERGLDFVATGYGSMVGLHFTRGPVRRASDIPATPEARALLHLHLLADGYWYARRGFVALSLPLGEAEVDGFAASVESFLATLG